MEKHTDPNFSEVEAKFSEVSSKVLRSQEGVLRSWTQSSQNSRGGFLEVLGWGRGVGLGCGVVWFGVGPGPLL